MANTNQSVRTCILKVDLQCCNGCRKNASNKLHSISGVTEVEYNREKGLMIVTGDVEPMALVRKLTKHGKKTELVSVKYQLDDDDDLNSDEDDTSSDTRSNPDPKNPMERVIPENMKQKTGPLRKPSLLGCFCSKSKVVQPLPMHNGKWRIPSKFANFPPPPPHGFGFPPPPHPMMSCRPMMQQHSQVPFTEPAMPCQGYMFQPARPPPTQPYFMSKEAQTINPKMHH